MASLPKAPPVVPPPRHARRARGDEVDTTWLIVSALALALAVVGLIGGWLLMFVIGFDEAMSNSFNGTVGDYRILIAVWALVWLPAISLSTIGLGRRRRSTTTIVAFVASLLGVLPGAAFVTYLLGRF
jgi:hypothetical protein